MKTTKPELEVPEAAHTKLYIAIGRACGVEHAWTHPDTANEAVRAIATPVVVAELRAQAAQIRRNAKYGPSDAWMTHKLERRASEIEAQS